MRPLLSLIGSAVFIAIACEVRASFPYRRLERPASQAGSPSTTSYAEKTLTWPAGGGTLDFDYFVDSEQGWDFLRVLIDGTQAYGWSGPAKAGHVRRAMTSGPHVVRFEYAKDSSVNLGLDTAFVRGITARDSVGVLRRFLFDDRAGGVQGWSVGGPGGGFADSPFGYERSMRRPTAQAFTGYQAAPTASRAERSFSFSGAGPHSVSFDYTVDSEPNYDFLRVYIDSQLTWQISGQHRGTKQLGVSAGTHTVSFEYYKDTSVDVGRDLAIVDNVEAVSDSAPFEKHSFDQYGLGALPYGWSASGASGGFVTAQAVPPAEHLAKGTPSPSPTVDGRINLGEYVSTTIEPLYDISNPRGRNGTLLLRERDDQQSLHIAARVHASSTSLGGESGSFTMYFDAGRWSSLATVGCGANGASPGVEDRKIVVSYSSTTGQPTFTITQYRGSCQGWVGIGAGEAAEWAASAEVREPEEDHGYIHFEIKVELKARGESGSSVLTDNLLGFGLVHKSLTGDLGLEVFPQLQGREPLDEDTWTWATLDFGSVYADGPRLSGVWLYDSYFH